MPTSRNAFRKALPWALSALVLILQGCLTIEENYTFKKDGSGKLEYVVDMSEMAEMMKVIPGMKDAKDEGPGKMELDEQLAKLKALPGIKKVKLKKEKEGFVRCIGFQFVDVNSLNGALNVLMPDSGAAPHEFFKWEGNTLVRTTDNRMSKMTGGMGGGTEDTTDATAFLKMMRYKFDLRFADELGDVQVAEGVVKEPDGSKRMKLSTDWSVMDKDPAALDMRITLKR